MKKLISLLVALSLLTCLISIFPSCGSLSVGKQVDLVGELTKGSFDIADAKDGCKLTVKNISFATQNSIVVSPLSEETKTTAVAEYSLPKDIIDDYGFNIKVVDGDIEITCPENYNFIGEQSSIAIFANVNNISIEGGVTMKVMQPAVSDKISVNVDGATALIMENIEANTLSINVNGAAAVEASGNVNSLQVVLSGTGAINTTNVKAAYANVDVDGVGAVVVYCDISINATINGLGSIEYLYGENFVEAKETVNGLGSIKGTKLEQKDPELESDDVPDSGADDLPIHP